MTKLFFRVLAITFLFARITSVVQLQCKMNGINKVHNSGPDLPPHDE